MLKYEKRSIKKLKHFIIEISLVYKSLGQTVVIISDLNIPNFVFREFESFQISLKNLGIIFLYVRL